VSHFIYKLLSSTFTNPLAAHHDGSTNPFVSHPTLESNSKDHYRRHQCDLDDIETAIGKSSSCCVRWKFSPSAIGWTQVLPCNLRNCVLVLITPWHSWSEHQTTFSSESYTSTLTMDSIRMANNKSGRKFEDIEKVVSICQASYEDGWYLGMRWIVQQPLFFVLEIGFQTNFDFNRNVIGLWLPLKGPRRISPS